MLVDIFLGYIRRDTHILFSLSVPVGAYLIVPVGVDVVVSVLLLGGAKKAYSLAGAAHIASLQSETTVNRAVVGCREGLTCSAFLGMFDFRPYNLDNGCLPMVITRLSGGGFVSALGIALHQPYFADM